MSDDAVHAWELCKENVMPVTKGRNVNKLNALLIKCNSLELKTELQKSEKMYEERLLNYTGTDPLEVWCEYLGWILENYPSDTTKSFALLDRVTRQFTSHRQYRNDPRYLRLWIQYIDRHDKPLDVFKFLYKNRIGDRLALFYMAWALLLEKRDDVKNAELIYAKGIEKKAEPLEALKRKHSEFEKRVSQKWLKAAIPLEDDDGPETGRTLRDREPTTITVPISRQAAKPTTNNSANAFVIYSENDPPNAFLSENKSSTWKKFAPAKTINKENEQKPSTWSGAGLTHRTALPIAHEPITAPQIQIFVDENTNDSKSGVKRRHAGEETRALRPRLEEQKPDQVILHSNDENPKKSQRPKAPSSNKRDILKFNAEMLKVPGEHDLCFEELRAVRYWKMQSEKRASKTVHVVAPSTTKPARNGFLVDENEDESVQQVTSKSSMPFAAPNVPSEVLSMANDSKYTQDDMTFNTRVAYEDIHSMFCSPTKNTAKSPSTDQITSLRTSGTSLWIPQTEEPIVRKLHFSAFKEKKDEDDSTGEAPAFSIFTEENNPRNMSNLSTKKQSSRKALVDRADIPKSSKKTNKDVVGFSLHPSLGERSNPGGIVSRSLAKESCWLNPYSSDHRKAMIQSQDVANNILSINEGLYVYSTVFPAKLPVFKEKGIIKLKSPLSFAFTLDMECHVLGRLGAGSYGSVYAVMIENKEITSYEKEELAMKHENEIGYLPWEYYAIQSIHCRSKMVHSPFYQRLHSYVIQVKQLHVYEDTALLCLQRGYKGTLHSLINCYSKNNKMIPENIVMFYTIQMLRAIDMVHRANFLHGDVKPDNWILLGSRPNPLQVDNAEGISFATSELCLIDFGRSIDRSMYPPGTCFLDDCHAKGFQCIEMLEKKPWTCQVDSFGVTAIAYFMLFGEYLFRKHLKQVDGRWVLNRSWKRYWRADLWSALFDQLLNVSSCSEQPDLLDLVDQLERYYTQDVSKIKELHELLRSQDRLIPKSSI